MTEAGSVFLRRFFLVIAGALLCLTAGAAPARAAFGVTAFDGETLDAAGNAYVQAGGHPFEATTVIRFTRIVNGEGETVPDQSARQIAVELPPGFVGNPQATPTRCTESELTGGPQISIGTCPLSSQVGVAEIEAPENFFGELKEVPVYNMVPAKGEPAQLGIRFLTTDIHIGVAVRSDSDYGVTATLRNISNAIPLLGTRLAIWGVPADPRHDTERGSCLVSPEPEDACPTDAPPIPFWSLPTACTQPETGLETRLAAESWLGSTAAASFISHQPPGLPTPGPAQGPSGCDRVPFKPQFTAKPTTRSADSPSGLEVDLTIPQQGLQNAEGLASAALRDATVKLPAGLTVDPASAGGLAACGSAQIGLLGSDFAAPNQIRFAARPAECPEASKLGVVEVATPLLAEPLKGAVYLAQQGSNPFGSLLAIYLVAEGDGVVVKLPGEVETGPGGQVTATFQNSPQLPFEHLHVEFFGGPRASLRTPESCGTYTATGEFTPWSASTAVTSESSFQVTSGPNGGPCPNGSFDPQLEAGTTNPTGGAWSPFTLRVSRADGSQGLSTISAVLPKGVLAKLAGTTYCPDVTLASIPTAEGTGAAQLASPSCPSTSQVGTVSVGAGAGPSPFYVNTGKAYLAGPYKGAPLSLAIVTPALAGPFDLGNVVVRTALRVDPRTAQVTAESDLLPTILHGIPLDLRDVRVDIDKAEFTRNPTSCRPMKVESTIGGIAGAQAHPSVRFQVGSCEALNFRPKLNLSFSGQTRRTGNPGVKAVLTQPKGENANVAGATVILPKGMLIDNSHINGPCTRVQFNAGALPGEACPTKSVLGTAKVWTPLLEKPEQGKVYFRSNGGERQLPDLVVALRGQIPLELVGFIDSVGKKGAEVRRVRTRFLDLPDAPVSRFELKLAGGKKGLLENSKNLCKGKNVASFKLSGQNGARRDTEPKVQVACGRRRPRQ